MTEGLATRMQRANQLAMVDVAIEQLERERRIDPWLGAYVEQRIGWLRVQAQREGGKDAS